MNCPNGHEDFKKYGTFKNRGEIIQRYKCGECGKIFSDVTGVKVNRIPPEKKQILEEAFKEGFSIRRAALMAKVHSLTAQSVRNYMVENGTIKKPVRNKSERNRSAYHKSYYLRPGNSHTKRMKQITIVRGKVALWLAKNKKPMSLDGIYDAMLPSFPTLGKVGLQQMLRANSEGFFKKVGDDWTYRPTRLWIPWTQKDHPAEFEQEYQDRQAARDTWFRLRHKADPSDAIRKKMEERVRAQRQEEHLRGAMRGAAGLRLMAAMGVISNYETNKNNSTG